MAQLITPPSLPHSPNNLNYSSNYASYYSKLSVHASIMAMHPASTASSVQDPWASWRSGNTSGTGVKRQHDSELPTPPSSSSLARRIAVNERMESSNGTGAQQQQTLPPITHFDRLLHPAKTQTQDLHLPPLSDMLSYPSQSTHHHQQQQLHVSLGAMPQIQVQPLPPPPHPLEPEPQSSMSDDMLFFSSSATSTAGVGLQSSYAPAPAPITADFGSGLGTSTTMSGSSQIGQLSSAGGIGEVSVGTAEESSSTEWLSASTSVDWIEMTQRLSSHTIALRTCEMICYLWFNSDPPPSSTHATPSLTAQRRATALQLQPSAAFVQFTQKLLETTQLSQSVIVLALRYIHQLKQSPSSSTSAPSTPPAGSEFRITIASLMLANKFLDDNTYTNKTWSEVSGLPLAEINQMEKEFIGKFSGGGGGLSWECWVGKDVYDGWCKLLKGFVGNRVKASAKVRAAGRVGAGASGRERMGVGHHQLRLATSAGMTSHGQTTQSAQKSVYGWPGYGVGGRPRSTSPTARFGQQYQQASQYSASAQASSSSSQGGYTYPFSFIVPSATASGSARVFDSPVTYNYPHPNAQQQSQQEVHTGGYAQQQPLPHVLQNHQHLLAQRRHSHSALSLHARPSTSSTASSAHHHRDSSPLRPRTSHNQFDIDLDLDWDSSPVLGTGTKRAATPNWDDYEISAPPAKRVASMGPSGGRVPVPRLEIPSSSGQAGRAAVPSPLESLAGFSRLSLASGQGQGQACSPAGLVQPQQPHGMGAAGAGALMAPYRTEDGRVGHVPKNLYFYSLACSPPSSPSPTRPHQPQPQEEGARHRGDRGERGAGGHGKARLLAYQPPLPSYSASSSAYPSSGAYQQYAYAPSYPAPQAQNQSQSTKWNLDVFGASGRSSNMPPAAQPMGQTQSAHVTPLGGGYRSLVNGNVLDAAVSSQWSSGYVAPASSIATPAYQPSQAPGQVPSAPFANAGPPAVYSIPPAGHSSNSGFVHQPRAVYGYEAYSRSSSNLSATASATYPTPASTTYSSYLPHQLQPHRTL